jgi:hypothetical protein
MKLIRHELRKLIEGIFIGDDDGTVLSPKDVDDFEYSGQVKDDEALGKHPKLDALLKSKHLPTKKQGRQLAVSLDYQDDLTPYEELAVDHIDPAHIHGPPPFKKTNMLQNPKVHRIQAEITKEFKQYIFSPEGKKFADEVLADWADAGYSLPRRLNWNHSMISNHRGFDLKGRIYRALGYNITDGYLTNSEDRAKYQALYNHLDSKLNKVAQERFNDKYMKVASGQIEGESFPLTLTETELKQMIMEELEERKKRKKTRFSR